MTVLTMAAHILGCGLCAATPGPFEPTSNYEAQNIEGWPVYVNRVLLTSGKPIHARALKELRTQLYRINRVVPRSALDKLHQVAIWVEAKSSVKCACHHPSKRWLEKNGFIPEKAKSV